jgi:dTDP-4-amino-4,6-dideoxygalactose transaminase
MKVKDPFNQPSIRVPAFQPWITKDDKKAVLESLNSMLLTLGPNLEKFETMFANFTKSKYAIGVSNGTSALHLSLKALGIGKGDEVIIPDLTFIADINSVIHSGATPVLADIEENDFRISIKSIKEKITDRTRAIIPVHMYGEACKMKEIMDVARSNKLYIIEDCAHAIGTYFKGKHVGTFGLTGCFSFYPTKNITSVEGGMVITNSSKIADSIRRLRNHGMTKTLLQRYSGGYPWIFDVKEAGYNYRLDELRSALGISQLKRIKKMNELRKKAAAFYNSGLKNVEGIETPKLVDDNSHSYHLYHIRIKRKYGLSRDKLFKFLAKDGIRTTVYYLPLHKFRAYKKFVKDYKEFPNSSKAYSEILALPLFPTISRKQQRYVIKCIERHKRN